MYQGPTYTVTATGGASGNPVTFTIDATASTVCSIAGSVVSFIGTGTCVINANQAGNANFYAAPQVQESFSVGPNLASDSYDVVGNTQLVAASHSAPTTPFTTDPDTVLANDTADVAITRTTVTDAATTGGGSITIDAAGRFTYTPPVGQSSGTDTYVYTGTANGVSRTGTITFTFSNIVWYVDNASGAATHDGRSHTPFTSMGSGANGLGTALAGTGPAAGAFIYVHKGSGATIGAYTFKVNQTLVSAGATLNVPTVSPLLTVPGAAGNTPTLNNALTLASGVSISMTGLDMDGASVNLTGTSVTGLSVNIGRFRRTGSSAAKAINLAGSGNTGNFDFKSVTVTGTSGTGNTGVSVSNLTGHFTVAGTDTGVTPNGGTISGYGGNSVEFIGAANGASTAVSLTKMTLTGNGVSQTVAGGAATCGGDLLTGNNLSRVANLFLKDSNRIVLDTVTVSSFGQMGINGNNVDTFSLTNSNVTNNGNEGFENGITFQNLKGTSAIQDTNVRDNAARQIYVQNNTGSVVLNVQNVSAGSMVIGNTARQSALPSQQGLLFSGNSAAAMTLNVDGITVQNNFGNGIQSNIENTASLAGHIKTSTFTVNAAGINLQNSNTATINFDIMNNPVMTGHSFQAINLGTASGATGAVTSKITGNSIGTLNVLGSGCDPGAPGGAGTNCGGITLNRFGANPFAVTVDGNNVRQVSGAGIAVNATSGAGSPQVKITNNNVEQPYNDFESDPFVISGNNGIITTFSVSGTTACLDLQDNTVRDNDAAGGGWDPVNTAKDMRVRANRGATVSIAAYGGGNSSANAITYLQANNTLNNGATADNLGGGVFANGPAACAVP